MGGLAMSVLILMIPMALLFGLGFLVAFWASANSGQFDDVETPAHRILNDDLVKNDDFNEVTQLRKDRP